MRISPGAERALHSIDQHDLEKSGAGTYRRNPDRGAQPDCETDRTGQHRSHRDENERPQPTRIRLHGVHGVQGGEHDPRGRPAGRHPPAREASETCRARTVRTGIHCRPAERSCVCPCPSTVGAAGLVRARRVHAACRTHASWPDALEPPEPPSGRHRPVQQGPEGGPEGHGERNRCPSEGRGAGQEAATDSRDHHADAEPIAVVEDVRHRLHESRADECRGGADARDGEEPLRATPDGQWMAKSVPCKPQKEPVSDVTCTSSARSEGFEPPTF
jgi:hypothetical protein